MKISVGVYIILLITLIPAGCRNNDDEEQRLTWSTDAPMSIPYRTRLQRHERGNLVRNPSFESGKIFKLDSATTSFAIDGWQQVGKNIEWTDIRSDSLYNKEDVFSGFRAVKISRKRANETDRQGEGILSDYIKVIPGNYSVSLYLKLENVMPLRARLGTRMFDAVEISVQFYDRNRNLMNSSYNYPLANQLINTSFKGLSFANYKSVSWFGWNKITGKSHSFPFPEGDIPSDAHFVRIFIGLKGTGTLWIDDVNFEYTAKNFSTAERMQPFTDTTFKTPQVIIPSPKYIIRLESVTFYEPDMPADEFPVITYDQSDPAARGAAETIQNEIRTQLNRYKPASSTEIILLQNAEKRISSARIIFSIGKTSFYRQYEKRLPIDKISQHNDGYFIYSPPDNPKLYIIDATTATGMKYAVATLSQMIDSKQPVFHGNQIIDYPDFTNRYIAIDANKIRVNPGRIIEQLREYKINGVLIFNDTASVRGFISQDEAFKVVDVEGYVPPDDSSLAYNYPLDRNVVLLNSAGKIVIPPVFHNEMLDNSDYSEVCCQVTVDAHALYAGSSFFSLNTDAADITRFSTVMGPAPIFLDNSMLTQTEWGQFGGNRYYPGKLRLYNIFEPFMNFPIAEFYNLLDTTTFAVNLPPDSEISLIRLATAADFMWNSAEYSPDYALWKVLLTRYGAAAARELVAFADKYSLLLETISKAEMKIQVTRNLRIAQQALVESTTILAGLGESLGNQSRLLNELQAMNLAMRAKLSAVQPAERK